MNRYLMFHYNMYYPLGGANDFGGSFDTVLACIKAVKMQRCNILDTKTGNVITMPTNLGADQLFKWARLQDKALKDT